MLYLKRYAPLRLTVLRRGGPAPRNSNVEGRDASCVPAPKRALEVELLEKAGFLAAAGDGFVPGPLSSTPARARVLQPSVVAQSTLHGVSVHARQQFLEFDQRVEQRSGDAVP